MGKITLSEFAEINWPPTIATKELMDDMERKIFGATINEIIALNVSIDRRFIPLGKREAELIHAGWKKLGWTQTKMREETKIDRAQLSRFWNRKRANLATGFKLALVISTALATEK